MIFYSFYSSKFYFIPKLFLNNLNFNINYSFYHFEKEYNVPDEEYDIEIKDPDPWRYDKVNNAGLTIPHELDYDDFDDETAKAIRELHGSVIDDRFVVGKPLGSPGFTGIVLGGFDLLTAEEVAIKFAERDKFFSLRKEHENYVYIGADGRCPGLCFIHIFKEFFFQIRKLSNMEYQISFTTVNLVNIKF